MRHQRPTVADLRAGRGQRQLACVYVATPLEAAAAEEAQVPLVTVDGSVMSPAFRDAAPRAFITSGIPYGSVATTDEYLRAAFALLNIGVDAVYCVAGLQTLGRLADEGVPVVSHVGLIPSKRTWTGGFRAVGKTADTALDVWRHVQRLEDVGCFGTEIEVVPEPVATEIARRSGLFTISMGSGAGCDAQYLFSEDILGTNPGHYPRHSKRYRDLAAMERQIQAERVAAFREYVTDVEQGRFPEAAHLVDIEPAEFERFLSGLATP